MPRHSPPRFAPPPRRSLFALARKRAGRVVVDTVFAALARFGRLHPRARTQLRAVECIPDIPYRAPSEERAHRLDVYRQGTSERHAPLRPAVLYVHGGGFRILSKESHWIMALAFARRGFVVFNVDYRLAPRHPYPAALEDVCAAYRWVMRNAHHYGADPHRLVLAGESAGANLVTALAVAASYARREPWAREVHAEAFAPAAVVAACGMLQVSDPARFLRRRRLPGWLYDRLEEVAEAYLCGAGESGEACELADPLLVLEQGEPPVRPLPPFFAFAGTRDPLLDDTRRLDAALGRLGVQREARYYPGEVHAFHAMVWRPQAIRCWADCFDFLDGALGGPTGH